MYKFQKMFINENGNYRWYIVSSKLSGAAARTGKL